MFFVLDGSEIALVGADRFIFLFWGEEQVVEVVATEMGLVTQDGDIGLDLGDGPWEFLKLLFDLYLFLIEVEIPE